MKKTRIVLGPECWRDLQRHGRIEVEADGHAIEIVPGPHTRPAHPQAWISSIPPLLLVPLVTPVALMASPVLLGMAFMSLTGRLRSSSLYSHPVVRTLGGLLSSAPAATEDPL